MRVHRSAYSTPPSSPTNESFSYWWNTSLKIFTNFGKTLKFPTISFQFFTCRKHKQNVLYNYKNLQSTGLDLTQLNEVLGQVVC